MRVLIAEDDPISRHVLASTLGQWDFELIIVDDGQAAWELLKKPGAPHLAILDWNMPGMDGVDICRRLRARKEGEYAYIILLTARGSKEDMVSGLEAGADDYIIKPFDVNELQVRLRAATRILDLQKELIDARETLREQATHDDLTGLWNRRAILDVLDRELSRAEREQRNVTVIMGDVDFFKQINDTYGHHVGDVVLQQVAERMNTVMRPYDLVGRYGGEEFLMVVPGCEGSFAGYVAERIRAAVCQKAILVGDAQVEVTLSLGVAAAMAPHRGAADKLIRIADDALYAAKDAGRNCVRISNDLSLRRVEQEQ